MAIIKPTLNLVASEYTPEILNVTRASGATRVNAVGLVERVGSGTLRYDYDPTTLAGKGWLIEEARTNFSTYSEDMGTGWVNSGLTETVNNSTAPDGTTTANLVTGDGATASPIIAKNVGGLTNAADYTMSAFVKAGSTAAMEVRENAATGNLMQFTLTGDGTIDAAGSWVDTAITPYPDGWYRIQGTYASPGTNFGIGFRTQNTSANTETFSIWGVQLEAGSFATSYIPTTTAAVTRAVDVVSADLTLNAEEYSMYIHCISPAIGAATGTWAVLYNDSNDYIDIQSYTSNITTILAKGGTTQVAATIESSYTQGVEDRVAISLKENDYAGVLDGGTVVTDVSCLLPDLPTLIYIGSNAGSNAFINSHIKHAAVFNVALSDADLQTITTG
jgi:hypothetical protein